MCVTTQQTGDKTSQQGISDWKGGSLQNETTDRRCKCGTNNVGGQQTEGRDGGQHTQREKRKGMYQRHGCDSTTAQDSSVGAKIEQENYPAVHTQARFNTAQTTRTTLRTVKGFNRISASSREINPWNQAFESTSRNLASTASTRKKHCGVKGPNH